MTDRVPHLNVALYEGAEGTTLRICSKDREDLRQLLKAFWLLASGARQSVMLHEMCDVAFDACSSLRCLSEPISIERTESIETECGPAIEWAQSVDQWYDCCGLLEGLLNGKGPSGHQYFSNYSDISIEVAVGEDM